MLAWMEVRAGVGAARQVLPAVVARVQSMDAGIAEERIVGGRIAGGGRLGSGGDDWGKKRYWLGLRRSLFLDFARGNEKIRIWVANDVEEAHGIFLEGIFSADSGVVVRGRGKVKGLKIPRERGLFDVDLA